MTQITKYIVSLFLFFSIIFFTKPILVYAQLSDGGYGEKSDTGSTVSYGEGGFGDDNGGGFGGCCTDGGGYDGSYDGGYGTIDGGYAGGDGGYGGGTGGDGGYGGDGNYGRGGGGNTTLSGYVFNDVDRNGIFNAGDSGLDGQLVQLFIPGSYQAAWQEVVSTDENGNPTGFIDHPASYTPAVLKYQTYTGPDGHYAIGNVVPGSYSAHHEPMGIVANPGWTRTTNGDYGVSMMVNHYITFGLVYSPQPPGVFYQNPPSASCAIGGIQLSWQAATDATDYYIYYKDSSVGVQQGGTLPYWSTSATSLVASSNSGLIPGHLYSFYIEARNSIGSSLSDNGRWSDTSFGWIQLPPCAPPGAFDFSQSPVARCRAVDDSVIDVYWSTASGTTGYTIFPQLNPAIYPYPSGLSPTSAGYLLHVIPTPGQPGYQTNSQWDYNIQAYNANGGTWVTGGSSYYHYGWISAVNCANPTVSLVIDNGDIVKTIYSGTPIALNYSITGSYFCASSLNPAIPPITNSWANLYPPGSNGYSPVVDPWMTIGSAVVTPINNSVTPQGTYQFGLQCTNSKLPVSAQNPASKTVTVNVLQAKPPFIQTTGGDVHSNKNISVPNQ